MPPFKQPVQLFDAALRTLNKCVVESCQNIQIMHGRYNELKCQEDVQGIQDYLLAYLPYHLLETMCSKIHLMFTDNSFVDTRIISSIFLHENCQKFNPKFELVPDSAFWKSKICMLKKIVVLNLKMVCTDDVLEVVGANCRALEYINMVSRVASLSDSANNFNALKLKFFVSDDGLKCLSECKHLKKIVMTKVVRSQCAGSKITHSGICFLLKSLPKLEVISFSDMGSVIDEIDTVDSLSLTSISDYHPIPQRILKISSLCPHLTELFLHLPIDFCDSEKLGDDILIQLCKSNLRLQSLNLNHFPLNESFNEFIKEKGKYLIDLVLSKHVTVSGTVDAIMLGYNCPNLEYLCLKGIGIKLDMTDSEKRKIIYTNLKCLSVDSKFSEDIDFNFALPVFLNNAKNIMCINLDNYGVAELIDKPLQSVMNCNPLTNLQKVNFFRGAFVSLEFLMEFIVFCPKLKDLTVHECSLLSEKHVCDLRSELKTKNYDLSIHLFLIRSGF